MKKKYINPNLEICKEKLIKTQKRVRADKENLENIKERLIKK